jgi:alpha-D-ribose 1-methylphosphonate 5-triphosphate synthase subunit PhnG
MAVLAQASPDELERRWRETPTRPPHRLLRPPETGLVMVRGRAGGTGMRFNVGEMTVTRCAVEVDGGAVGVGYVRGRNRRHAELAAVLDALLQDPARHDELERVVVAPLADAQAARRRAAAERVAPSKVEFFTMVRGDD